MREEYFPNEVIEQTSKNSIEHKLVAVLVRFYKPHYYECDSLKDYVENIEKIKDVRIVSIDGLRVESILEHESRDPNEGYIILRDLFQERMKFLVLRRYGDRGYRGLDEESWAVFRALRISDNINIGFIHGKTVNRTPFWIPEQIKYSQRLISLHRDNNGGDSYKALPPPDGTHTLDEIIEPDGILVPVRR